MNKHGPIEMQEGGIREAFGQMVSLNGHALLCGPIGRYHNSGFRGPRLRCCVITIAKYQMLLITAATLWLNPSLVRSFHCPSTWNVQTLSLHLLHHHRQFWQNHYHFLGVNQLVMIPRVKMMRTVVLKTRTTLMIFSVHIQPGRI